MNVVLLSGKAEHGKTSVANILKEKFETENKKVLIINFADYLKFIAKTYYGWNGIKDSLGRETLQFLGTDLARKKFPNFWVDAVINVIKLFDDIFDYFIIGDCRFVNELTCFKEENMSTTSVRVIRLNYENSLTKKQRLHLSETSLDNFNFDYVIESESGLDNLEIEVDKFLQNMRMKGQ